MRRRTWGRSGASGRGGRRPVRRWRLGVGPDDRTDPMWTPCVKRPTAAHTGCVRAVYGPSHDRATRRTPPDGTCSGASRAGINNDRRGRRSSSGDVSGRAARISSEPAVTCERAGFRFGRRGDGQSNHHRIPAPRLMAIVARSVSAVVKRARFAFTKDSFMCGVRTWSGGRAVLCRNSTQDPWLCVSTSRWICPGRPLSGRPLAHIAKLRRHRSGDHGKLVLPPSHSEGGVALQHRLRRPVVGLRG